MGSNMTLDSMKHMEEPTRDSYIESSANLEKSESQITKNLSNRPVTIFLNKI